MTNNKSRFPVSFTLLFLVGVVLLASFVLAKNNRQEITVDLPRFLEEKARQKIEGHLEEAISRVMGSLRKSILAVGKITIPLKDYISGRTITDKTVQLQTTGACQFCDLGNADLREIDLHNADLRRADLSGADLSLADLRSAKLTGANLAKADLSGTNLTDANLSGTDLTDVILTDANLTDVNLSGTDLSRTNLTDANLTGANLTRVDLTGTDLTRVTLYDVTLEQALLTKTDLSGALLGGVDLNSADLTGADLSGASLTEANLSGADLSGTNMTDVNLRSADLRGTNLTNVNLTGANLAGANLSGVSLSTVDLTGSELTGANLSKTNLSGVDLSDKDLNGKDRNGTNLSGADLTGANLTGANLAGTNLADSNLTGANLTRTFLYDAKLVDVDMSESNLSGARLSGADLTGANLRSADLDGVELRGIGEKLGESLIEIKESGDYKGVTSFDLSGDTHYLTTRSGILYEWTNEKSTIVLDLNTNPKFHMEAGLMSVVSNENFVYISYTIQGDDKHKLYLVVDEYSKSFNKVRSIIKIGFQDGAHHAGTLVFDSLGKLYLSVGDGFWNPISAQNLESLRGKILRLDVSKTNPEPEIVAYGLRNPWKISIDSKDRMFIGDCGNQRIESAYLLGDLYPTAPYNLGWPVFEGTERNEYRFLNCRPECPMQDLKESPLMFQDTLAPIYEYSHYAAYIGVCAIGGSFLEEPEVYLLGDYSGVIRLLKKQRDGKWHEIYHQQIPTDIWSFGYHKVTKQLFVSGSSKIYELAIPTKQINFLPRVKLCRTTMPNGTINNSDC